MMKLIKDLFIVPFSGVCQGKFFRCLFSPHFIVGNEKQKNPGFFRGFLMAENAGYLSVTFQVGMQPFFLGLRHPGRVQFFGFIHLTQRV